MIGYVAGRYLNAGVACPSLDIYSRWPLSGAAQLRPSSLPLVQPNYALVIAD